MKIVRNLSELQNSDTATAGGKGASLGELLRADIAVPPGFVVLTNAFDEFLQETDLKMEIDNILHSVNLETTHTIEDASARIQTLIKQAKMPRATRAAIESAFADLNTDFVAVRSSATAEDSASAAWAGQLDTFLNVKEDDVIEKVQACWASLFTPRAIFYRGEQHLLNKHMSVAVVIQEMVASEYSGIAFSVHPVTEDYNQLIIEAGFGLGEAIVSGSVTPDSYMVEKDPRRTIDTNVSEQTKALYRADSGGNEWQQLGAKGAERVLTDEQILQLSTLILQIEQHYGCPQDIEWAYANGQFYITQSRPITTLKPTTHNDTGKIVTKITTTDWTIDWSGAFPAVQNSIAFDIYSEGLQKVFGVSFSKYLITYKDGIATGRMSQDEHEKVSMFLLEKVSDIEYARKWSQTFIEVGDEIMKVLDMPTTEYLEIQKEHSALYKKYGAYNVATKLVFDHLSDDEHMEIKDLLEAARKHSESFYADDATKLRQVLAELNAEVGYDVENFLFITRAELAAYLTVGIVPTENELSERRKASLLYFTLDQSHWLGSSVLEQIESAWISMHTKDNSLQGVVAYKGSASGCCRIINKFTSVNEFNDGDILVTGMTDPGYISLMKKAAAIVTDGGGMLSHAAIVARELKKPCVIGTKIATQVLHDGDEVEVDADNGVVRVLKKAAAKKSGDSAGLSTESRYNRSDYMLSFQARGVSILVVDIHAEIYSALEILAIISNGLFKQYFTKKAYEQALGDGVEFYNSSDTFARYRQSLEAHNIDFTSFVEKNIIDQEIVSSEVVEEFFTFAKTLCGEYTKMNIEYTDRAFLYQDSNAQIKKNMQEVATFKDNIRSFMDIVLFVSDGYLAKLLNILHTQFAIPTEVLAQLKQSEILALHEGLKPNVNQVLKRQQAFVEDYHQKYFEGVQAEEIIAQFSDIAGDSKVIRGQVANQGSVIGIIKVISIDYGDLDNLQTAMENMQTGQILVSETTAPELTLACQKASAIVTDLGGLLSHAAIVSRELNIPCIVGTEFATQVLHDGDEVEVDADNGVVRVLQKACINN